MPSKQMSLLIFIGENMNVKSNSTHIPSISLFFFFTSRDGDKIVKIKTLRLVETFSLHFYQKR